MEAPVFRDLGIGRCQCCGKDNVPIADLGHALVNKETGEEVHASCPDCMRAAMDATAPRIIARLRDLGYNAEVKRDALGQYKHIELVEQKH